MTRFSLFFDILEARYRLGIDEHIAMFLLLTLSIINWSVLEAVYQDAGCKYTFQVWQPDQDILNQMRQIRFKFDNFTSYANYDMSKMKLEIVNDLRHYENWTRTLEKDVMQIRLDSTQTKMNYHDLDSEISSVSRELHVISRKLDDLEMDYFKMANHAGKQSVTHFSNGRKAIGDHQRNLIGILKNSVGDLKAEWLLVKRELDRIRRDNAQLKVGQDGLRNDTLKLKQTVRSIVSTLQSGIPTYKTTLSGPPSRISGLSNELARVQEAQEDLKYETIDLRNEISTLQNRNTRFESNIHELQVENTRLKEEMKSLVREERTGRDAEVVRA